jgi:adenylate kinase family enzyme
MYYEIMRNIGKYKPTLIVNMFGGPGSGKSIICANVFSELKWQHITAEMALEYVKEEVWENNTNAISNQLFILGNQHQRIKRLIDQVDVVIVDSPLLLSILYNPEENENFNNYVVEVFNKFRNLNIFVERNGDEYEQKGRLQNLTQAKQKDIEMKNLLNRYNIDFQTFKMEKESVFKISELIKTQI